jgi:prophage maintenance system killer protein/phage regulator Rha-like protein
MNKKTPNNENQILIYKTGTGQYVVEVLLDSDTVWLTQKQMAELFDIERSVITKHISNVFKQGELKKVSVCANFAHTAEDGKNYQTVFYNLDMIIAVGYRVNAKRGTQFRIWATRTLKDHLLKGYTINQKRLAETGIKELENALQFIKQASSRRQLTNDETQGLLDVIAKYAKSWLLLKSYDEDKLPATKGQSPKFSLAYEYALNPIKELKKALVAKNEASNLFGNEREHGLEAILGNLEQSFGGQELYPTLEEKAAHLLYFIIKDHPFSDGNKRIGSLLFIHYLDKNNHLYKTNGEILINDNALVALALLIAESEPKNKELMIALIKNLLSEAGATDA